MDLGAVPSTSTISRRLLSVCVVRNFFTSVMYVLIHYLIKKFLPSIHLKILREVSIYLGVNQLSTFAKGINFARLRNCRPRGANLVTSVQKK